MSRPATRIAPRLLIAEHVVLTLWVGSLWAIGYLAVPVLFALLDDRQIAGSLAGQMFRIVYYLGLVSAVLLLVGSLYRAGWRQNWFAWVVGAMLLLVTISVFVLQPMMADLKMQGLVDGSLAKVQFSRLHHTASTLYLVTSVLGLVAVILTAMRSNDAD